MGARRKGRIIAFQTLYRYGCTGEDVKDLYDFSWLSDEKNKSVNVNEDSINFAKLIIAGTLENIDKIDTLIKEHLEHWDFSRISRVDLAVLRISVYCLIFQTESIPPTVTIDEAVDIVKDFGSRDSYRFINGVLDSIRKSAEITDE
jgi:N utilization substance protein B